MQINGTVNKPALESLLVRVSTHICKNPGTSLDRLQRKFEPALLPQWTRELLEVWFGREVNVFCDFVLIRGFFFLHSRFY